MPTAFATDGVAPPGPRRNRIVWGLADQALSSLTNFGLTLVAAKFLSAGEFGSFAVVFAVYALIGGLCQAISSTPLSVRFSGEPPHVFGVALSSATGTALVGGLASGMACVVTGLLIRPDLGAPLVALGVALPGLMLQDAWRFTFVAQGRARSAALNDLIWALVQALGFTAALLVHRVDATLLVLVWGGAANLSALFGCFQARRFPDPMAAPIWIRTHWHLIVRYAAESLAIRGSGQAALLIVGAIAGVMAAGSLRGAQVMFGPLSILVLAGPLVGVPEAVRTVRAKPAALRPLMIWISVIAFLVFGAWGLALIALPEALLHQLLGSTTNGARPLLLAVTLQYLAAAVAMGPQIGLRSMAAATTTLRTFTLGGVLLILGTIGGIAIDGVGGAAYGMAIAGGIVAVVWWWRSWHKLGAVIRG